ncbi:hypothetical protein HGA89_02025, partial [bacterium]|nr:hypothetical protein [bacterium]
MGGSKEAGSAEEFAVLRSLLKVGENVLSIAGYNFSLGSSDFLIVPELDGTDSGTLVPDSRQFFPQPTPFRANRAVQRLLEFIVRDGVEKLVVFFTLVDVERLP